MSVSSRSGVAEAAFDTSRTHLVVALELPAVSQTIASGTRNTAAARTTVQPAGAMKSSRTTSSLRSTVWRCSINPCVRRQLLLVYIGIGIYIVGIACWWGYMRSDTLPLDSSNWLATHKQRLIRSPGSHIDDVGVSANTNATVANIAPLKRELACIGWHQTAGCDPDGAREPANDVACNKSVAGGASGYCAMRDVRTGKTVRVMQLTCMGLRRDMSFKCDDAVGFADFQTDIQQLVDTSAAVTQTLDRPISSSSSDNNSSANGIVMVMYPKLLASVYASIRSLRALNCSLPVELWYLESEMSAAAIAANPILQTLQRTFAPVTLHAIAADANVAGFTSKVFAIAHTALDGVLFLDADNIAVRDPTFLFESPAYERTGAVFWPDFWHPVNTIFNVQSESLLWELVGTRAVDMFEQESGQLLIDKRRSAGALQLLQLFAFRQPSLFDSLKLVHGDKDLFRLAWLRTNTSFHMVARPPAAAGRVNAAGVFCGMTMAQYDPQERDVLFLHRNAKKLTGGTAADPMDPQVLIWTHLQTFDWDTQLSPAERYALAKQHFTIAIYGGGAEFPETGMCYGERRESAGESGLFHTTPWSALPSSLRDLEPTLLLYAREALALPPVENPTTEPR